MGVRSWLRWLPRSVYQHDWQVLLQQQHASLFFQGACCYRHKKLSPPMLCLQTEPTFRANKKKVCVCGGDVVNVRWFFLPVALGQNKSSAEWQATETWFLQAGRWCKIKETRIAPRHLHLSNLFQACILTCLLLCFHAVLHALALFAEIYVSIQTLTIFTFIFWFHSHCPCATCCDKLSDQSPQLTFLSWSTFPLVVLYMSSTCPVVSYLSPVSCFFCSACTLLVLCQALRFAFGFSLYGHTCSFLVFAQLRCAKTVATHNCQYALRSIASVLWGVSVGFVCAALLLSSSSSLV